MKVSGDGMKQVVVNALGIRKNYGDKEVLKGVDLTVHEGEVMCLIGPSGSGKSTLLRCINHLESPSDGVVLIDNDPMGYDRRGETLTEKPPRRVAAQRARIGMVFQHFNLFPHMTVLENVLEAPTHVLKTSRKAALPRVRRLLEEVGLSAFEGAYPGRLSGGQQQRVAIVRALAMEPRLILFDEPTSALDPELVGDVLHVMKRLARQGMTMVVVTHEIGFAREVADTVVFMDDGDVVEQGRAADVIDAPQHARTQDFLAQVRK